MKQLTAEDILGCADLPSERVVLEGWKGYLYIRTMTGAERDDWEASMVKSKPRRVNGRNIQDTETDLRNMRAKLIAIVACDKDGNSVFTPDQVVRLGKKSASELDKCFDVAKRLNHLSSEDMEELVKNSESGPSDGSGLSSPAH